MKNFGSTSLRHLLMGTSAALLCTMAAMPAQAKTEAPTAEEWGTATPAPARRAGEGLGPFNKMVIRGVTLIDGTGAPPRGPVDIVVEKNVITSIKAAGSPGLPMAANRAPTDADYELDATGMYMLPGFIDMHTHASDNAKAPNMSYSYKLWMAHGVTTVRGVGLTTFEQSLSERDRSARNEIVAPRIFNYSPMGLGKGWTGGLTNTPEKAREWVRWAAKQGMDGVKIFADDNQPPEVLEAVFDEAKKLKLGTVAHLSQIGVARMNAMQAGEAGLGTVTHFYGHMESLLKNGPTQDWDPRYNYSDEQWRFSNVANLARESFEPGTKQWTEYLEAQKKHKVVFDPTMTIYAASRDLVHARNADWHGSYTMPQLWDYYQSSRINHGSYFFDWSTEKEIRWKNFYKKFMTMMNDYKNIGGRVVTGSDSGFIFKTYGFGYIEELELLQEAGFNPMQVVQAATLNGALTLYEPKGIAVPPMGTVRVGKLADMVLVKENPLENFKTLYGTGALRLNEQTQHLERVGGVSYTIKDGIVYDAKQLLADVADMVRAEKRAMGRPEEGVKLP